MKTKFKVILIVIIIIIGIILLPFLMYGMLLLTVPISRSDDKVRGYVSDEIPMGTSWDNTFKILDDNDWKIRYIYDEPMEINGNTYYEWDFCDGYYDDTDQNKVGKKALLIKIGEYYSPFHTSVQAYLVYDENNELIDVRIRRDIDAI